MVYLLKNVIFLFLFIKENYMYFYKGICVLGFSCYRNDIYICMNKGMCICYIFVDVLKLLKRLGKC